MPTYPTIGLGLDLSNWERLNDVISHIGKDIDNVATLAFDQVIDGIKLNYLSPVANFAALTTTYPDAEVGDAAQTLDDNKTYRFNGFSWVFIQQFGSGPFTDVYDRLDTQKYFVNVKEFGAVGDGFTDDKQAFLDALQALKANGGGTLFIPASSSFYAVSNSLEWDETYGPISILGEGRSSHIKLTQKSLRGHLLGVFGSGAAEANWVQSATIKKLQLSTYNGSSSQDDNPIGMTQAKNVLIEDVYVPFSNWKGITAQRNCKNITIRDSEVSNCKKSGIAIEFSTVEGVTIENTSSHHNGIHGLDLTAAGDGGNLRGIKLSKFKAYNNTRHGVATSGVVESVLDVESFFNTEYGVALISSSNVEVRGNVYNNNLAGIWANGGSKHLLKANAKNNSISDANNRGNLFLQDAANSVVSDCDISQGVRAYTNWSENVSFVNVRTEGATNNPSATTIAASTSGIKIGRENRIIFAEAKPSEGTLFRGDVIVNTRANAGQPAMYYISSPGKAHLDSTGTLTSGSNRINNVTNIATWKVGDIIKAPTIPFGTTVTSVGTTSIDISAAPTTNGTYTLYDAKYEPILTLS